MLKIPKMHLETKRFVVMDYVFSNIHAVIASNLNQRVLPLFIKFQVIFRCVALYDFDGEEASDLTVK